MRITANQIARILKEVVDEGYGAFPVLMQEPEEPYIFLNNVPRRGSAVYIYLDGFTRKPCWWVGRYKKGKGK